MSDSNKNETMGDGEVNRSRTDAEQEKRLGDQRDRRERLAPNRRRNLIIVAAVALVVLLLLILLIWKWRSSTTTEAPAAIVVSVKVAKVEKETIAAPVSAVGTIFPREQATVAAKVSAQIKTMALLKNKFVKAGEVIAVLESRDLVAQRNEAVAALNQERASERSVTTGTIPQTNAQDQKALRDAQAKVKTTKATYDRRLALFQAGGISKKDLEASQMDLTTAENELLLAEQTIVLRTKSLNPNDRALAAAKVQAAQQRVATLDAQLSYATIRAPISGIVTDQFQYEGEFAAAGGKLVNIADISQVIVKAPFADTVTAQLKVGDSAKVVPTDTTAEEMTGQVTLISKSSDPLNRTVEVWVTLANGDGRLRANGAAQVTASTLTKDDAIVVPTAAVTLDASNANEGTVMVVDAANVAHETKVVVGIRTPDKIEITEGLQAGETVVSEGNYALPDGTKVEVSEDKQDEEAK
ncbi:MAG TPA: efflux RND transporter periplasmic adaptor subunit [Pyrinomonadaceae bacterium]|nr:efflux RND transporter periplasmic adaptor subunit [Pyrinomonadaceae bacterium]